MRNLEIFNTYSLADLGGVPSARPPTGPNSFVFTHFHRKAPGGRRTITGRCPPEENPGSTTVIAFTQYIFK